jgi:alanine or glycine:cation symporter, AGCS family
VQQAIRFGMVRTINSTEVGLGTAGIFYGSTKTNAPVESSIMSMTTSFVATYGVGLMIMLLLVASGVWNSGATSSLLTMQAYATVFGIFGDIIVAFLAITFGAGVLVGYAYIGRECWAYVTGGRWMWLYTILYAVMAFFGSLAKVDLIWNATGILNAGLLIINLFAVVYLSSYVKKGLVAWERAKKY